MNKRFRLLIIFLPLVLFISMANAKENEWTFDTAHSRIYFDIRHTYATVRGEFNDFSGSFSMDPESHTVISVNMAVRVESVDTGIQQRDDHLKTADFFDVDKYPLMTFESKHVRHISGDKYQITGDLTVKDVTREVTVPFTFLGMKDNPMDPKQMVAGYEGNFTLDRLAYNVGSGNFFEMGAVGREVNIILTFELLKDK